MWTEDVQGLERRRSAGSTQPPLSPSRVEDGSVAGALGGQGAAGQPKKEERGRLVSRMWRGASTGVTEAGAGHVPEETSSPPPLHPGREWSL